MGFENFLTVLFQGIFIALGVVTALNFLHHRDRIRRDIALLFGSLALPMAIALLSSLGELPGWVEVLGVLPLLAQPYLILRVVGHLQPVPLYLRRLALAGMLVTMLATVVLRSLRPAPIALTVILYFVVIDGYAMLAFIRGAVRSSGVVRQRLRFAAAGVGLLAAVLAVAGGALFLGFSRELAATLSLVVVTASALCFYVSFAPPRWLRRIWQFAELRAFLMQLGGGEIGAPSAGKDPFQELCGAAQRAVSGLGAFIVTQNAGENAWQTLRSSAPYEFDAARIAQDSIIRKIWRQEIAAAVLDMTDSNEADRRLLADAQAASLLLVGITTGERLLGVLLVFLGHTSLFPQEELNLLRMLAQQGAVFWENLQLIERLQAYSEGLEHTVQQRTAALRQSEERFRSIFEQAAVGIVEASLEGQFMRANERFCKMLGYAPAEIPSLSRAMVTHPDDYTLDAEQRAALLAGQIASYALEKRYRHKEGHIIWGNLTCSLVRDAAGHPQYFVKIIEDITERRKAQEALDESERRYHSIIDNMMEGFQIIGFDWRYLYLNDSAARYGRTSKEELLGHTVMEKYPGIEETSMFAAMRRCMETRVTELAEFEFTYPDGETAWFEFSIQPVPEGIFILSLDITERKHSELALQQLNAELEERVAERTLELEATNKELEAFSYSVSHDLRAPLRALDGFSQALLEDYLEALDSEGQTYLQRIRAASQHMARLIDDLLSLSRITRAEMTYEQVDLSALAHGVCAGLREAAPERAVQVTIHDGLVAEGDPRLLRIALENLMGNAWKFTARQAQAHIEVGQISPSENGQVFYVRDNGAGFDMAYANKLFGAFQRLHSVTEFEGTGIGLATVQRIIHRHGGRIWAESEVGQGATFYFTL